MQIEKNTFAFNLALTQKYCGLQLDKDEPDNAKVFRTFSPLHNGKPMFSFEVARFDFDIKPGLNYFTLAKWLINPVGMGTEHIFNGLFEQQIAFKQQAVYSSKLEVYEGEILISEFDYSVIDGASEAESLGFIDIYDMPPIDTWFYFTKHKDRRILFSWIPKKYERTITEAISVNFLDLLAWFKDFNPSEYKNLVAN